MMNLHLYGCANEICIRYGIITRKLNACHYEILEKYDVMKKGAFYITKRACTNTAFIVRSTLLLLCYASPLFKTSSLNLKKYRNSFS